MKPYLIFIATVLVSQSANADCGPPSDNPRKCYDNTNAPLALVYKLFINGIFSGSLEDEEYRIGRHYVEAGLTPNMNSDDVIRYFVPKYLEIEKEVEETQNRMLCLNGKPRYEGDENFTIFNYMDDVTLTIYEKHLFVARSDLSISGLFDLDKALKEYPASFVYMFAGHKEIRDGSIQRIYEQATELCSGPRTHGFNSSRTLNEN